MVNCEGCKFFLRARDYYGKQIEYGECRINPPQLVPISAHDLDRDPRRGLWPRVLPLDCCGQGE